jgi:protein-tyrosine phosphatase
LIGLPLPDPKDLGNFGWVEPYLARGADPNPAGFAWLARAAGIKSIVNLRAEDNTEAFLAAPLGFAPVYVPVVDNKPPTAAQADAWLAFIADEANHPVFVHCQNGHGRTSTFCILFRVTQQGWKLADAIEEAVQRYGFDPAKDCDQIAFLDGYLND